MRVLCEPIRSEQNQKQLTNCKYRTRLYGCEMILQNMPAQILDHESWCSALVKLSSHILVLIVFVVVVVVVSPNVSF